MERLQHARSEEGWYSRWRLWRQTEWFVRPFFWRYRLSDFGVNTGNRSSFRTDSAISKNRFGNERVLQPWVPDANDTFNGGLEKSGGSGTWDQFAANERLFGVTSNYDDNFYTTAIDKSHPEYRERVAAAERKAREIERSAPTTAHVAEERIMDYVGGDDGGDEEDK